MPGKRLASVMLATILLVTGSRGAAVATSYIPLEDLSILTGPCAIVVPSGFEWLSRLHEEDPVVAIDVADVPWQAPLCEPRYETSWRPIAAGDRVEVSVPLWMGAAVAATYRRGATLLVGLSPSSGDISSVSYVVTPGGRVLAVWAGDPDRLSARLGAFLTWRGREETMAELLGGWSEEAHLFEGLGAIGESYEEFEAGARPRDDWASVPPERRVLRQAPKAVRDLLQLVEVWIRVPEAWQDASLEGPLCTEIDLGSNECVWLEDAAGAELLAVPPAYVMPEEALHVAILAGDPNLSSDVPRSRIGTIPWETLRETGIVLIELDPRGPAPTGGASNRVTGHAITEREVYRLVAAGPVAVPRGPE